ncbi:MAG: hypothetical protein AB8H79_06205, partial [Myxococcota bacterium]
MDDPALRSGGYRPLIYSLWGSHDLATIHASDSIASWPPSEDGSSNLMGIRQSAYTCFLPKAVGSDTTLNDDYLKMLDRAGQREGGGELRLPPESRFMAVIQVKLAPLSTWPRSKHEAVTATSMLDTLRRIWQRTSEWRSGYPGAQAAVGLTLAWNEVVVVAHAVDLHALAELTIRIRTQTKEHGNNEASHVSLSTTTTLGFDFAIDCMTTRHVTNMGDPSESQLHELAAKVAAEFPEPSDVTPSGSAPMVSELTWSAGFAVNPGHEHALQDHWKDRPGGQITIGQFDFLSPPRTIKALGAEDGGGALDAVSVACLPAAHRTALNLRSPQGGNMLGSASFISVASHSVDGLEAVDNHINTHPRSTLLGGEDDLGMPGPTELRSVLRSLQIPYSQAEQVLASYGAVQWALDSPGLWEQSIELIPPLLALRDSLKILSSVISTPEAAPAVGDISVALASLHRDLDTVLAAMRAALSAPHWHQASFFSTADLNLRRKGALGNLPSISNLIACSMLHRFVGIRACLTVVGEVVNPDVTVAHDIVILKIPAATVDTPILLDGIASEISRVFAYAIADRPRSQFWGCDHPSEDTGGEIGLNELRESWRELSIEAFVGGARVSPEFMSTVCDFFAARALASSDTRSPRSSASPRYVEEWTQCQALRQELAILASAWYG